MQQVVQQISNTSKVYDDQQRTVGYAASTSYQTENIRLVAASGNLVELRSYKSRQIIYVVLHVNAIRYVVVGV